MIAVIVAAAAFLPMLIEAFVSASHERTLKAQGAVEPAGDVIHLMQFAYPCAFACVVVEAWLRRPEADVLFVVGAVVFAAAKALKYWAIATLGTRWTFRVLVPPGSRPVRSGPYTVVRHPNYIAVIGELGGAAMMAHAAVTGPIVTLGFALLIVARIKVEERALGIQSRRA